MHKRPIDIVIRAFKAIEQQDLTVEMISISKSLEEAIEDKVLFGSKLWGAELKIVEGVKFTAQAFSTDKEGHVIAELIVEDPDEYLKKPLEVGDKVDIPISLIVKDQIQDLFNEIRFKLELDDDKTRDVFREAIDQMTYTGYTPPKE